MAESETTILDHAVAGDRIATGRLLMRHDARLRRKVAAWIPRHLQRYLTVDDVLQETYSEAFRHISSFDPRSGASFYAWLVTIAQRRFLNARRWLLAGKRGLDKRATRAQGRDASMVELLQILAGSDSTPSRKVVRLENEKLLHVALAGLKDDYREALSMRYLEGRPVREIASAMGRTDRAVHMLCNRGLRALREAMGSASRYLNSGS